MAVPGIFRGLRAPTLLNYRHVARLTKVKHVKPTLAAFSEGKIPKKECMDTCIRLMRDLLDTFDCDLTIHSRHLLKDHWEELNNEIKEIPKITTHEDAAHLIADLKRNFTSVAQDKWAAHVAGSFHSILPITDRKEQIINAKRWTHQFFEGADFFSCWEDQPLSHRDFILKLEEKTSSAFHSYSQEICQKKMAWIQFQSKNNLPYFLAMINSIEVKLMEHEGNLACLSDLEKDFYCFLEKGGHEGSMHLSSVEKNRALLNKCVWSGFSHWKERENIMESDQFLHVLEEIFSSPKSNYIHANRPDGRL